jgi:hypothetical protein
MLAQINKLVFILLYIIDLILTFLFLLELFITNLNQKVVNNRQHRLRPLFTYLPTTGYYDFCWGSLINVPLTKERFVEIGKGYYVV